MDSLKLYEKNEKKEKKRNEKMKRKEGTKISLKNIAG